MAPSEAHRQRTLPRRTGEAKAEPLALSGETGRLLAASVREARALARSRTATARRKAGRIRAGAERLERLAERSGQVVEQIRKRLAGEPTGSGAAASKAARASAAGPAGPC